MNSTVKSKFKAIEITSSNPECELVIHLNRPTNSPDPRYTEAEILRGLAIVKLLNDIRGITSNDFASVDILLWEGHQQAIDDWYQDHKDDISRSLDKILAFNELLQLCNEV